MERLKQDATFAVLDPVFNLMDLAEDVS